MHTFEALGIHTLIFPRLIKGYSLLATIVLFICGYHDITFKRLLQILQFAPSGSSIKTLLHYLQCHRSKKLKPYEESQTSIKNSFNEEMLEKEQVSITESSTNSESGFSDDSCRSEQSIPSGGSLSDNYSWDEDERWHATNYPEDIGSLEHLEIYSTKEDIYSLNRINIPISIWWAEADWAASKVNISRIVTELPKIVNCWKIEKPTFGHLDFLWGRTGTLYKDLNEHLDDTSPSDWDELKRQLDYVGDNIEQVNSRDNAFYWYFYAMSANVRFSLVKLKGVVETHLSGVHFF